jgi:hypothetical protein
MFYIIETKEQLYKLQQVLINDDIYLEIIPSNNNYHTKLNVERISLLYIRPLRDHKGYIVGVQHNELVHKNSWDNIYNILRDLKGKVFVSDKKNILYYIPELEQRLYDINFIENIELEKDNKCFDYYYNKFYNNLNTNTLIPISKHYEKYENRFKQIEKVIEKYNEFDLQFKFNNFTLTKVFYEIEKNGLKLDKENYIKYYSDQLYSEFNVLKSRIYTHYNLYTTTGRPSNSFNNINFAAFSKSTGERGCIIPENDLLCEMDINGYHPRIIGELINKPFPNDKNVYNVLSEVLGTDNTKELTFKQLYGGVKDEFKNVYFFKEVAEHVDDYFDQYQRYGVWKSPIRIFNQKGLTAQKLFNYIIQSYETFNNVIIIQGILELLKTHKTKLILYTYDAFLFDFNKEDGYELITKIQQIIKYPVKTKFGKNYNELKEELILREE